MNAVLSARGACVSVGACHIVQNVDLDVRAGELLALVGPNGAGKSTLLKALAGDIALASGGIVLNKRGIAEWTPQERALQRAVLPQSPELAFSFRVWETVEFGRHPHRGRATRLEHNTAIAGAMAAADVGQFAARDCRTLSGGEAHRVHYARALAQLWKPLSDGIGRVLLLDEPTSSLDLFHQHAILAKALEIARGGMAVMTVLHDLNLAATYADRIAVLDEGRLESVGSPHEIITAERIGTIWRVGCEVVQDPMTRRPQVLVRPRITPGHLELPSPAAPATATGFESALNPYG